VTQTLTAADGPSRDRPPVLDRLISPRSRTAQYPIHADPRVAVVEELVDVEWALTPDFPLNQGQEGACVGFGTSAELSAAPMQWPTGNGFAQQLYQRARAKDKARGYDFAEGATVLAGLEAAQEMGLIQGFRWAQRFEDIALGLQLGPVVMGTDVTDGMYSTTRDGEWRATGTYVGGHCWTIIGFRVNHPLFGRAYLAINSWGAKFGLAGKMWIREATLRKLWDRAGEAALVVDTRLEPVPVPDPVTPTPAPEPAPAPKPKPKPKRPWWWNPTRKTVGDLLISAGTAVRPPSP
jgi:hypothetical protein